MKTKIIQATQSREKGFNHGKFLIGQFDKDERAISNMFLSGSSLLNNRWCDKSILVLDIETGEGAVFRHGGLASYDLNSKHQIWCCPLYEPFLEWLYSQDITDITKLPDTVELPNAPEAMYGYRRKRDYTGGNEVPTAL